MDHSKFSQHCLSYLKGCLVNYLQNFLKESYRNVNVALYEKRLWLATLFTNNALNLKKTTNNKNKAFGAFLANLSEAFVCWSDDLLIANFHVNSLDLLSRA